MDILGNTHCTTVKVVGVEQRIVLHNALTPGFTKVIQIEVA